jgi:Na+-transporting methylmalonyl-CoA/oxaloacetate decarboxylase gamma subunit
MNTTSKSWFALLFLVVFVFVVAVMSYMVELIFPNAVKTPGEDMGIVINNLVRDTNKNIAQSNQN